MGVFKWLAKRGTAGGTARTIANQYIAFLRAHPGARSDEFYASVVGARHATWAYTGVQLQKLNSLLREQPLDLGAFIAGVIFIESDWGPHEIAEKGHVICEIVQESLVAVGLAPCAGDSGAKTASRREEGRSMQTPEARLQALAYIRDCRIQGHDEGTISKALQQSGWAPDETFFLMYGDWVHKDLIHKDLAQKGREALIAEGGARLHEAVVLGYAESVRLLLECGVSPNGVSAEGLPYLCSAVYGGFTEVVWVLAEAGADVNVRGPGELAATALHLAVLKGNVEAARCLLLKGADPNARDRGGSTPLLTCVSCCVTEIARLLLRHGADPNLGHRTATPLHLAASTNNALLADILLGSGACIDARAEDGLTPLHVACGVGAPLTAKLLLERGADVRARTAVGQTPLSIALEANNKVMADILRAHGAS